MAPAKMSKHWCFTINNPTDDDIPSPEGWTYLVYGRETGDSGTPHLQGYGCREKRQRLSTLSKVMPRAHLAIMRGTPLQAAEYCKKDGDFTEHGTMPDSQAQAASKAQKGRWDKAKALAIAGKLDEIDADIYVRSYNALKRIQQDHPAAPEDLDAPTGIWIWGEPGVGKSYYVRHEWPQFFDKNINKWWDGYRGQDTVILDDVDLKHRDWLPSFLKRWADEYSFPAEVKGTTLFIRPKRIVVTSNYSLDHWCAELDAALAGALKRRFTVLHKTERMTAPVDARTEAGQGIIRGMGFGSGSGFS